MQFFIIRNIDFFRKVLKLFKKQCKLHFLCNGKLLEIHEENTNFYGIFVKREMFDVECPVNFTIFRDDIIWGLDNCGCGVFDISQGLLILNDDEFQSMRYVKDVEKHFHSAHPTSTNINQHVNELDIVEIKCRTENYVNIPFCENSRCYKRNEDGNLGAVLVEVSFSKKTLYHFPHGKFRMKIGQNITVVHGESGVEERIVIPVYSVHGGEHEFICYGEWAQRILDISEVVEVIVVYVFAREMHISITFSEQSNCIGKAVVPFVE